MEADDILMCFKRIMTAFMICAVILVSCVSGSAAVYATEDTSESTTTTTATTTTSTTSTTASTKASTTTSSTTTTTKATTTATPQNGVAVSQLFCYGSNNKLYNQLIKFSSTSESYTANVSIPLWMKSIQVNIKSVSGAKITYDGTEFSADGSMFTHTLEFDAATKYKTTTYKFIIKKDDKESTLTLKLSQTVFETKLESVSVDSKTAEGSNEEGYKYILPSGTSSCRIKLRTRSEESVTMGKAGTEPKKLELNSDKVFLEKVQLEEGENKFNISVISPGATINTTLTIYVGEEPVSSQVQSEPIEEEIFETDTSYTDLPSEIVGSIEPEVSSVVSVHDESDGAASPLIWVLIGVVIAIVIGACIFMIASMGGGNKKNYSGGYSRPQYTGTPYRAAPPPARRRDLGRFVEDDYGYDDYYGDQPNHYPEDNYYPNDDYYQEDQYSDDGYYQDGGYYDNYNNSQDRYDRQPPQRQQYQSQRRGNRNDFDDFYDDYYN